MNGLPLNETFGDPVLRIAIDAPRHDVVYVNAISKVVELWMMLNVVECRRCWSSKWQAQMEVTGHWQVLETPQNNTLL